MNMTPSEASFAFADKPCDQFTFDDLKIYFDNLVDRLLKDKGDTFWKLQHLEDMVSLMCFKAHSDAVLRQYVASAIFNKLQASVRWLELCIVHQGVTQQNVHMEKALSDLIAMCARYSILRDDCEELMAQLQCPKEGQAIRVHKHAYNTFLGTIFLRKKTFL